MSRRDLGAVVSAAAVSVVLLGLSGCGGPSYDQSLQMIHFNYGEVLDGHMRRAEQALGSIRDMASAEAAAAQLHLINQDLDDLVYNAGRLSPEGQIALGELAAGHLARVEPLREEIDANPTLAEIFGTELQTMVGHLQALVTGRGE